MRSNEKHYSDKEIGSILQRALEIEGNQERTPAGSGGLSAAEIETVAKEVGISVGAIQRAIAEYDLQGSGRIARLLLGGPVSLADVLQIGRRMSSTESERLDAQVHSLQELRNGQDLLRSSSPGFSITVSEGSNSTEVRVLDRLHAVAGGLFGGLVGGLGLGGGLGVGLGVGIAVLASPVFMVCVPIGFVAAAYILAREIYRRIVRDRSRIIDQTMNQIRALLSQYR